MALYFLRDVRRQYMTSVDPLFPRGNDFGLRVHKSLRIRQLILYSRLRRPCSIPPMLLLGFLTKTFFCRLSGLLGGGWYIRKDAESLKERKLQYLSMGYTEHRNGESHLPHCQEPAGSDPPEGTETDTAALTSVSAGDLRYAFWPPITF